MTFAVMIALMALVYAVGGIISRAVDRMRKDDPDYAECRGVMPDA